MNAIYEQPLTILIAGTAAVVVALIALIKTGRIGFLYGAGGLVVLTAVLLLVERNVITVKEELRTVLDVISDDLTSDNVPAVLNRISSSSPDIRKRAERILKQVRVDRISIKPNLKVVPKDANEDHVIATFNAVAVGSERRGSIHEQPSPQFFIVEFVREDGDWKILTYDRKAPQEGLR